MGGAEGGEVKSFIGDGGEGIQRPCFPECLKPFCFFVSGGKLYGAFRRTHKWLNARKELKQGAYQRRVCAAMLYCKSMSFVHIRFKLHGLKTTFCFSETNHLSEQ